MHSAFANGAKPGRYGFAVERQKRLSATPYTVFEANAKPGRYGYQPHSKYSKFLVKKKVQEVNELKDAESFMKKFNQPLLPWWPMLPDGKIATHLYRLLDEQDGCDIKHPLGIDPAISHKLRGEWACRLYGH